MPAGVISGRQTSGVCVCICGCASGDVDLSAIKKGGSNGNKSPTGSILASVSKMCVGDRREVIPTFNERLKQCFTYKEDSYLPESNESWFNFEQPVTSEYDGNAEKMREWFVKTCELVMNLGNESRRPAKKRLSKS